MTSRSSRTLSLAIAAVLGASGVALLPTSASGAAVSDGFAPAATAILSPVGSTYTVGDDGTDTTVRLEAGGGSTVSRVRFEYRTRDDFLGSPVLGQWTAIETVSRNDDGAFAAEWAGVDDTFAPPTRTYDIRAVPLDASGNTVAGASNPEKSVSQSTSRGVNLTNGQALGYFVQAYGSGAALRDRELVSISGTTGALDAGANDAARARSLRLGFYTSGDTRPASQDTGTVAPGAFTKSVAINDASISETAGAVNQLVMLAELTNTAGTTVQADETESYTLYKQTITSVSATADRTNVLPGEQARVTVQVLDQNGKPVVGAEVRQRTTAAPGYSAPEYTDATGRHVFLQGPGSTSYFVNTNDTDPFAASDGDKETANVTVTAYQPVTTSLVGISADGAAFDLDEADNVPGSGVGTDGDATDVTVQVKDQQNNNVTPSNAQALSYHWVVTPFGGGATSRFPSTGSSAGTVEADGRYSAVVPNGGNGTYELFASLSGDPIAGNGAIASSKVLTVKAGQAVITYDKNSPEEAAAGGTTNITGRLGLTDGTNLPGRALAFTFQRDTTTTNEDATPDAGFGNGSAAPTLTTSATTAGNGSFALQVNDPAENPQQSELGDNIDAASTANDFGNAGAAQNDHVVNFVQDTTASAVTLTESRESSTLRPGEFTLYTVKVSNRLGGGLANQDVELTTDAGYFSLDDGSAATTTPTPSPVPASGADAGTYANAGNKVTVRTGADGTATVFLAMGRDNGFDDDGQVSSKVTATSGAKNATDNHVWSSSNPLNGGAVTVVASKKTQDSAILPQAQTSDSVYLDIKVTDQFGNAVGGESVTLTDDSATGTIAESDGTANDGTIVTDFEEEGDVTLSSTTGAPQKLTATWSTERTTYTGAATTTTTGTEILTGSYTAEWYAVDYAASNITFTSNATGTREVGSSVTLTYKALDQLGQPISDLFIDFARTGPGTSTDPATASDTLTGADGLATYTFTGTSGGRADVTATARQGSASGEVVTAASKSASVQFEVEQVRPEIMVSKRVRGDRLILKVTVTASNQSPVVGDVQIREGRVLSTKTLNDNGKRKFVLRGLKKGFHSLDVTFLGNEEVEERTRTVNINLR